MEAEDPLSQLRDIHLPDAVALWPPAPGWWFLLALVLVGLAFAYRQAIAAMILRRKLANVLDKVDSAYNLYNEQATDADQRNQAGLAYLARINSLLNRVALVIFPESPSEILSGRQWLSFLDSFDDTSEFSEGPGIVLAEGMYRRTFDADVDALHGLVISWIEKRYQESKAAGTRAPNETRQSA